MSYNQTTIPSDDRELFYLRPPNALNPNLLNWMDVALSPATRIQNISNRLGLQPMPLDWYTNQIVYTPPPPPVRKKLVLPSLEKFSKFPPMWDLCYLKDDEDSLWRKILACIPLIGIVPAEISMHSLRGKMHNTNRPERNIYLLKIINQYKACSTLRAFLTVALAVSALSFQILSAPVVIGLVLASCCSAARSIYDAILNAKMNRAFENAASVEVEDALEYCPQN